MTVIRRTSQIPLHVSATLAARHFQGSQGKALRSVTDSQWRDLFSRWEFSRLLIPVRQRCGDDLPEWVRSQLDRNLADNAERFERIKVVYADFVNASRDRGAEHLVLKGFAQWPGFVEHPRFRLQSDIDVYCPPESISEALDALYELGYEPAREINFSNGDHLPTMVPRKPWTWRGNCYDPEIPVSFELHFCFWNESLSRLRPRGLDQFWLRRVDQRLDDLAFPALAPVDNLAYSALNVLRDTLQGQATPHLVYELARFLHTNAGNEHFWKAWQELHEDSLRSLEAISFCLAFHSFGCRLSEEVQNEIDRQPKAVQGWFQEFAHSPLAAFFRPNKDTVWLHLSALESSRDRRAVLLKRLFPTRLPSVEAPQIQNRERLRAKGGGVLRKHVRYATYLARRAVYHAGILPATLWHGVRWWWSTKEFGKGFLPFLAASFFFNFGMYVFFFLYNLYLLDVGFRENFLGAVTGAVTIGGVAGTLPAGMLVQRLGLRKALLVCLALVSVISALRSAFVSAVPLLVLAFLVGFVSVIWAVALSPIIAELTSEKRRTFGFSVVFSFGIAVGILGGQAGGRLPGWLMRVSPVITPAGAKEVALLLASGIIALALIPASRLELKAKPFRQRTTYSLNPFLFRFLTAIALWGVVAGGFSPFFSAYFSRHWQMPIKRIGMVDSMSRISQLLGILAAPALFRKLGLVTGIAGAQMATAIALACLASASGTAAVTVIYMGYVAFQWMYEPGIFTLLMNHVEPNHRAGASALTFLVINVSQALATVVAGASFVRFGYPAVIAVTALVSLVAALLFRLLLGQRTAWSSQNAQESAGL